MIHLRWFSSSRINATHQRKICVWLIREMVGTGTREVNGPTGPFA